MNKKLIIASLGAVLSFGAFADTPQPPQNADEHGPRNGGGMMANLTEDQKSCIAQYGCAMPEKPAPGEKPEMSAEKTESMECMRNAMTSCGVQMPDRPEKPRGEKPADAQ
ncbi:MAG: hypothetical protein K2L94_03955 [Alphaproteobacteria bacterium]|nr:hypothetical protein [Alphaproteobacteria bacterium]